MRVFDKFDRYGKKVYNSQDVLKKHFLQTYPIIKTDDTNNLDQVYELSDKFEYVWLVDKNIETLRTFPWHYRPTEDEKHSILLFPYILKESKYPKSWDCVKLVPTTPTKNIIKKRNICGIYDAYKGKDKFDIFYLGNSTEKNYQNLVKKFTNIVAVNSYAEAQFNSTTDMFWLVPNDVEIINNFDFSFRPDEWSYTFPHVFGHDSVENKNGIVLFPKTYEPNEKELLHRFYVSKKEIDAVISKTTQYDKFVIETYDNYLYALEHSETEMFWALNNNLKIDDNFNFDLIFNFSNTYDRTHNHAFIHRVDGVDSYNGIFLFSKHSLVTKKEIDHRFIVDVKEWPIIASGPTTYDIFNIEKYDDYLYALKHTKTEMFWATRYYTIPTTDFKFDIYFNFDNEFDKRCNHVFKHDVNGKDYYKGIFLFSKHIPVSKKEIENWFLVQRKEWDILASTSRTYNIFTIDTYDDYTAALTNSKTELFWGISNNLKIDDNFKFDLFFDDFNDEKLYDRTHNHAFIHRVDGVDSYNGVFLFSKHSPITKKEIENRFIVNVKEWPIVASGPVVYEKYIIESYNDYLYALEHSQTEMFWGLKNYTNPTEDFKFNIYFNFDNTYDKKINHAFIHKVNNKEYFKGIFLFSKQTTVSKKEIENWFLVQRKEWNVIASTPKLYEQFIIETYDDYNAALKNSKTELFWGISNNLKIDKNFKFDLFFDDFDDEYIYDRTHNHAFIHRVNGVDSYNGVFLFSKHSPVTKKEIENRFIVNVKEWPLVASGSTTYDIFNIDSYDDYLKAYAESKTEMFWRTSSNVTVDANFTFDTYFNFNNTYDKSINHVFINRESEKDLYNGVFLLSKKAKVSKNEIDYNYLVNRKEWNIVASTPAPYDIIFISKSEPLADENYKKLKNKVPRAKRVHGITGIHNAHIEAAKLAKTDMFWVVDADAEIVDDFNFNYYIPFENTVERQTVYVWRSKNPINGLVYGYGGVKLLPREKTLYLDKTKPDVTTSISEYFKPMDEISNITAFNTDPFNTWKSAFRECVKLASKSINRQVNAETEYRLNVWCNIGEDQTFGDICIRGALEGREYGLTYANDTTALQLINDWDWLQNKFIESMKSI